jgi:multicomponent Na+:H+ antiporter subunit D
MDIVSSPAPVLALAASLVGAILILVAGKRWPNLREAATIAAALTQFGFVLSMQGEVLAGKLVRFTVARFFGGISFEFTVDAFGMIFALLASFLWIVVSVYSIGYVRGLVEHAQTRYYFCFAVALFGATGVALAGNLLTLYLFYEVLTLATYPLVAHKETDEALRAGRKYLTYLLGGAVFVLTGMALTYTLTGSLDFVAGGFIGGTGPDGLLRVVFAAFMVGFGTKAAMMPLHEWLPSAMVAPVAVVKAGVFCVLRVILYVFGPDTLTALNLSLVFAGIAAFTVILANVLAITQDNLKRRLAFSTVNSLALIVLGAALVTPDSVLGSMLHITFHGFMKITLFMCAGAIYVKTHKELVSELDGIGRRMPVTMGAFAVASAGLVGIPGVCGFISKWYLCLGALEAGTLIFLAIFITSALMDAIYLFPVVYHAFFKGPAGTPVPVDEAHWSLAAPLAFTAVASVLLGLFPDFALRFFTMARNAGCSLFGG